MKNIIYLCFIFIIGCNNDSKKAMEICDCMGFYEIIHNESHIKETKECLGKISVNIDYYEPKNKEYIYKKMSENGENLCPKESRKFWHFLRTINERSYLIKD